MNSANIYPIETPNIVESKLSRMKELDGKVKELQAEYDMLKGEVIEMYFDHNEEYKTSKGLVLATYKPFEMTQFQATKFKTEHPDVYENYTEKKVSVRFLLKK